GNSARNFGLARNDSRQPPYSLTKTLQFGAERLGWTCERRSIGAPICRRYEPSAHAITLFVDLRERQPGEHVDELLENDSGKWSQAGKSSDSLNRANGWRRIRQKALWAGSLGVILYSTWVLIHVASMGTIGVRCMFGTKVEEEIPDDYNWAGARPQEG